MPSGSTLAGTIRESILSSDIGLALGIVAILVILIMPLPSFMLDISLAISITFSVLVLMTVLFIQKPLEISSFPTILLIATMLRLALNIASTRLILTGGHEGTDAAGRVIEAFGSFVMQGSFIIGIIVFSILVIVNFVVITKGSGRIAEVAARFTLDAMPGKQMAIDADLSTGLITEDEAKERRANLEDEASFFGAMDGASKFVRGDAVAGLLITIINVVAGMIIGVGQIGLSFVEAAQTYTLLTVGDGLVSQIPALIVSVSAGLLVSKAGVDGTTDKALFDQLSSYPKALGMVSFLIMIMGLLPGIPILPFFSLAGLTGFLAYTVSRDRTVEQEAEVSAEMEAEQAAENLEESMSSILAMDDLRLELGYGLLPLINDTDGHKLTDQIRALRRQLAAEMGFVMPSVRILDNMQLDSEAYSIRVKEAESGSGTLRVNSLLIMDPRGGTVDLPGEATNEPTFGLPAKWIEQNMKEEASFRGYTVVEPATVLTTHLTEILKANMPELLSYAEVRKLLDELTDENQKLVDDIIPSHISLTGVQRVLQHLLDERVSIRDLPTILEAIAEATSHTQNIIMITEHVRSRISRQICHMNLASDGTLPLITLSPDWEQAFAESIVGQGDERQLAMAPSQLHEFIAAMRDQFDSAAQEGEVPALLTSPAIRPFVRSVIERFRPQTIIMSQSEIHPQVRLRTLGQI